MCLIKDRNGIDLTKAEDMKKRWQGYTELYKKDLQDQDNHDGVITHLEPDILECEAKRALGSVTMNKASGGDGIPVELFQIIKMMLGKCCTQYASKFGNSAVAIGLEMSVFIPIPKKGNAKECSDYHTIALISTLVKKCSKFSSSGFNSV